MAMKKTHRIGILVILIVTVIGTIGSFAVLILSSENQRKEETRIQQLSDEYSKKVKAQTDELNDRYYEQINQFSGRVGSFDRDAVDSLKTQDLAVGTGEEITSESTFSAYYIGWNPWGKIFDQSIEDGKLKNPFSINMALSGEQGGVIEGWREGLVGMKLGGVRELTIPASKAYGDKAQGDDIPANTPLKFIVLAIPTPAEVEMPQELMNYYLKMYGAN